MSRLPYVRTTHRHTLSSRPHPSRILTVLALAILVFPVNAAAISNAQRAALNSGVYYFNTEDTSCTTGSTTTLIGSDNIQQGFNFFIQKGLTAVQASGIMGNLLLESAGTFSPTIQEGGGSATSPTPGSGFGIAQWTSAGRQQALVAFAQQRGTPVTDLATQLDFLWQELTTSYSTVLQHVQAATTVEDATNQFMGPTIMSNGHASGGYENPGSPHLDSRIKYAQQVYSLYGTTAGSIAVTASSVCGSAVNCADNGTSTGDLSQVRQKVVCIAQQELAAWTPPPPTPRTGFTKYTEGVTGTVSAPEEWCADFVSWVYNQAGDLLQTPNWRIPAVAGVQSVGEQNVNFHYHDASSYTPRPGDLAIHGKNHINLVISVSGTTVELIGGDQGQGPYGGPNSASVVSIEIAHGFTDQGITGYVSPD